MCEQLEQEPNLDDMPPAQNDYPHEVQVAFLIHGLLPDRWEGRSGYYMGKDLASLGTLLVVWEVEDKKSIIFFLKHIEGRNARKINADLERKRSADKNKAKAKGGINSANIKR